MQNLITKGFGKYSSIVTRGFGSIPLVGTVVCWFRKVLNFKRYFTSQFRIVFFRKQPQTYYFKALPEIVFFQKPSQITIFKILPRDRKFTIPAQNKYFREVKPCES